MNDDSKYLLGSVDNSLKIIDLLSHHESLSLAEICRMTNFSKTSIFRMLYTLEKNQYVEKNKDGSYSLGIKFMYYSNVAGYRHNVVNIAKPFLSGLANKTKLSVQLGILNGIRVLTVHQETSPYSISVISRLGFNASAHTTAMGRIQLSHISETELEAYGKQVVFKQYSPNSITSLEDLKKELIEYKKQGYAIDDNDRYPNFSCAAAPIFDYSGHCVAAVGIIVPSIEFSDLLKNHLPVLIDTAAGISTAMGYRK